MSDNEKQEYEYRIVLELAASPQGSNLHSTQQRLLYIMRNPDYARGWIERRPLGAWEMFPSQEQQRDKTNMMTNEEKITALTNAASDAYHTTARFAYLAYVQRLRNRFQQWGNTASDILLAHLEDNGYTIAKIEQRSDDERESSAVVVGAAESGADTEAQTG